MQRVEMVGLLAQHILISALRVVEPALLMQRDAEPEVGLQLGHI
jgi:hypothetical protein